jgi:hypothetical protein
VVLPITVVEGVPEVYVGNQHLVKDIVYLLLGHIQLLSVLVEMVDHLPNLVVMVEILPYLE